MSQYQPFELATREDVSRFEILLDQYVAARSPMTLPHISLTNAFDYLGKRENPNRVFAALLDVQINFLMLWIDSVSVGAVWASFAPAGLVGGSILDSQPKFFGKMDIHRFNSSFVLRYRALWDKIMGFLILMEVPAAYDQFYAAKSRKKAFRQVAKQFWHPVAIDNLMKFLNKFDDSFRTAEAHGTGVLRKSSFTMEPLDKNPQLELLGYWNVINGFIAELGKLFTPSQSGRSMATSAITFDGKKWVLGPPWDSAPNSPSK